MNLNDGLSDMEGVSDNAGLQDSSQRRHHASPSAVDGVHDHTPWAGRGTFGSDVYNEQKIEDLNPQRRPDAVRERVENAVTRSEPAE
jgi:hypothetical protein